MTIQVNQGSDSAKPGNAQTLANCNLDYLHRMSGGDGNFIKEMIRLFLKQMPLELENLKLAASKEDPTSAKQIAHKMKSSVSMVGAENMLILVKNIEITAAKGTTKTFLLSAHAELLKEFTTIKEELEPLLQE